jgi:hypothetical protein
MHAHATKLGAFLGAALLFGCGSSSEPRRPDYPPQPQPMQPSPGTGTAPGATTAAPAPTTSAPTTPAASGGGSAQEVDASLAEAVKPLLQQLLKTQVPAGAKPMGNLIVANFSAPGQKLEKQLLLTGNKCYTVVAAGVGVAEVNLKFVPVLPMAQPIAEDKTTGPQAVLGPSPNCYNQMIVSAPMNLVIEVPQGQGLVAVQAYEK